MEIGPKEKDDAENWVCLLPFALDMTNVLRLRPPESTTMEQ
jgi:hypothetical protein